MVPELRRPLRTLVSFAFHFLRTHDFRDRMKKERICGINFFLIAFRTLITIHQTLFVLYQNGSPRFLLRPRDRSYSINYYYADTAGVTSGLARRKLIYAGAIAIHELALAESKETFLYDRASRQRASTGGRGGAGPGVNTAPPLFDDAVNIHVSFVRQKDCFSR